MPIPSAQRVTLPADVRAILSRLDEIVRTWNEAEVAGDLQTCDRLSTEVDVLTETILLAVLCHGSSAVREHFSVDERFDGFDELRGNEILH